RAGLRGAAPLARGGRRAAPAESRAGAAATALARAHPPAGLPPGLARSGRGAARSDLALSRRGGHGRAAPRGRPRRRLGPHAVRGAVPLRRAGVERRRPVRLRGRLARADRSLTGAARWRRRMPAAAQLWALPGGVIRASTSGLERFPDAGTQAWRSRLPGGAPTEAIHAEGVLACAGRGVLTALDAADGRPLGK